MTAVMPMAGCAYGGERVGEVHAFENARFTVCAYRPARMTLRLMLADHQGVPLRRFKRLAAQPELSAASVRFAMNAGMFDTSGRPIGLYIENGVVRHGLNTGDGAGNFYMTPNGVFFVAADGKPAIETTLAFARRGTLPPWATQSGPMLVIDGTLHPDISPDGASKYVRNAVGIDREGAALFAISEAPVSFGRLARFLRDGLGCRQALYLDGYVSSLWIPSQNRRDDRADLGPMVVVTETA